MGSKTKKHKDKKSKKEEHKSVTHLTKNGCKIPVNLPCPECPEDFHLNLAGLTGNLNFQLLKSEGCNVEIDTASCDNKNKQRGKIFNIGIDFIELKKENGVIVTILRDKISQIIWLDSDCNPLVGETHETVIGKE